MVYQSCADHDKVLNLPLHSRADGGFAQTRIVQNGICWHRRPLLYTKPLELRRTEGARRCLIVKTQITMNSGIRTHDHANTIQTLLQISY